MRIAISGKSGCGNTTVSTLVSQKLGYELINFTFRQLAAEKGVEFWEFCRMAEKDDNIDRELDSRQVKMAMDLENCVLGSRLAIWMLKEADLKVYLYASAHERASRVFRREGGDFDLRMQQTEMRDHNDTARYRRIYGIDNDAYDFADLVIDTQDRTPEAIADMIIEKAKSLVK